MDKVSIITRAYNKLEYTIRCIESVRRYTRYNNYEHIIINNNSSDGTDGWLNWIHKNKLEYFKRVKPFNMDKNYGDWGGMLKGLELVSEDSEYVVQMDNDIEIKDPYWIQKMMLVLDNTDVNIIQLRRMGVRNYLIPKDIKEIEYNGEMLEYGLSPAKRPVAFFMLKTKDFKRVKDDLSIDLGSGKSNLSNLLGGTYKFSNVGCHMIDAWSPELKINVFQMKYPHELTYQSNQL
jgi:glycosyltransferase involved in cell wall biosynthesis